MDATAPHRADGEEQFLVDGTHKRPSDDSANGEPPTKQVRLATFDQASEQDGPPPVRRREKVPGMAMIKEKYLIEADAAGQAGPDRLGDDVDDVDDDDAAEGRTDGDALAAAGISGKRDKRKQKLKGDNTDRDFGGRSQDAQRLCSSRANSAEFSPKPCRFGTRCNYLHDLRKYLREGRRPDLDTLGGKCPVFEAYGRCPSGWKCRFVSSHMQEVRREDGRKELVLVEKEEGAAAKPRDNEAAEEEHESARPGTVNNVAFDVKTGLARKRITLEKSEAYLKWLDAENKHTKSLYKHARHDQHRDGDGHGDGDGDGDGGEEKKPVEASQHLADQRAAFVDAPPRPSEKRRLYFGPETPVLAPLTTQGNLPFRRLCVQLGAQGTYSEMALAGDILQGKRSEWALMRAHESEVAPPRFDPAAAGAGGRVFDGYNNSRDVKFGAQISANAPWVAAKAAEALTRFLPHLRLLDLNCGCPIDLVYKTGAGSALLESSNKLERIVRGMNAVSGDVPVTAKLRIGVRDGHPSALKNIERLALGGPETAPRLGAPGCAAITLHGRTRAQRYRRPADWAYIAECAALVRSYERARDDVADTVREPDENTQPAAGRIYFLGNGDCLSHEHYAEHVRTARVDTVMVGRGALVKPWLFEEIATGQYLDKTAGERLAYVESFVRYGLEAWGSDEMGISTTRRFLFEYLSFASRYVPIGILEYLPPSLNDRPPAFRCRNDLETLLASRNWRDWLKISEMFLGPAHPDFHYEPKHKSNSYEG